MWPFSSTSYKHVVEHKLAERAKALAAAPASADANIVHLNATASDIVLQIQSGAWTASEVLEAYIARAAAAQERTNCLTEVLFEEARKEARALDQHFASTKQLKGPLHGVPVSFKETYDITGYDSALGFTKYAAKPATSDADLVEIVRKAGGIPFVKTNVPQTLFFFECINPMWGRTLNPYSLDHTSGGSSGGECALLAMDGSALGWGTDIGGSLRIPAGWCGVYSLKPSHGRVSNLGSRETTQGFEAISTIAGPIGRSVGDIELAARVAFGQGNINDSLKPVPYRDVSLPEKLRFGYYTSDGFAKASPACQRAVLETVSALRQQGHECLEFAVPEPSKPIELFVGLTSSDSYKTLFSHLGSDPRQQELAGLAAMPKLGWLRYLVAGVFERFFDDRFLAGLVRTGRAKRLDEYWQLTDEMRSYSRQFHKEIWEKNQFDGIICPVIALPPLPHTAVTYVSSLANSCILYNVLDGPVATIPVTRVDPDRDGVTPEWTDPNVGGGHGSPLVESLLYKGDSAFYNAEKMAGLPVGIQLVGKKWEEEKTVEMMKVVDKALGERGFGPGSWSSQKKP